MMLVLMMLAGCGSDKPPNRFEFDVAVNAPAAASALVDARAVAPVGGIYAQGFPTVEDAALVHGTVTTVNADGSVRATAMYQFGTYCAAITPLLRQTERFVESTDAGGALQLVLDSIECERTDGTGTIVTP
jgi:hypothetical protein